MKAEDSRRVAGWRMKPRRRSSFILHPSAFVFVALLLTLSCKTVGVSRTEHGYAEVATQIANEMILDSRQVVILDVRSADAYRGPHGHIAGALSTPFNTIERQLPELLPYQGQTVLVYGETSTDGAVAAKLLTMAGFRNVVHIAGGIQEWIANGYRTVNAAQ
jgi:rhodanese-related sulfurtransferase